MKITEISWLKNNRDKLDKSDLRELKKFDFYEQIESGELGHPLPKMLELMQLSIKIYGKYNEPVKTKF